MTKREASIILKISILSVHASIRQLGIDSKNITKNDIDRIREWRETFKECSFKRGKLKEVLKDIYVEKIGNRYKITKSGTTPKELGWCSEDEFNKIKHRVCML